MKKASLVFVLTLLAGLWFSNGASACGRRCANIAPPGSNPCLRCIEDEASTVDCRNSAGSCGCFFKLCEGFSAVLGAEEAALASIFSPDAEPAACSGLPSEITEAAAD